MFPWKRKGKDDLTELELDSASREVDESGKIAPELTEDEQDTVAKIESDFANARASREDSDDDTDLSIEDQWLDEYYIYKGGGLQWLTKFAYRSKRARKIRYNSESNFVFSTLTIQHANITAETPTVQINGVGSDDEELAKDLTCMSRFNDDRNEFEKTWKQWVYDFIGTGPTIAMVTWDSDWNGGRGPERWIGDVRVQRIDKTEMYFDPSILDLEQGMQECSYIVRRVRKKLKFIRDKWESGKFVSAQHTDTEEFQYYDEGADPKQSYVIEYWHRGFPWFVPEERKKELREKALQLEQDGDVFKAKDYYDSAEGILEGVHIAYVADGVLLEYRPYEYEHGKYPFVFTTRYYDEKSPWGFGEIRNIKIPQVLLNKADEIQIAASVTQGLGGGYYNKGAIHTKQIDNILENSGKPSMWFEVDNVAMIKERTGVQVPSSLVQYKDHQKMVIESVSNNPPIQQGRIPSSNTPGIVIQELGARSDVRMNQISNKLEDFLVDIYQLRLELFAQFYTEERYYRIKGTDGKIEQGSIDNKRMQREWEREQTPEVRMNPETGMEEEILTPQMEKYVPEFDVTATVVSKKPNDRNYYTQLAMQLYQMQLLTPEDLLETLEEGKLPPNEDILKRVYVQQPVMGMIAELQELPPEVLEVVMQQMKEVAGRATQMVQMQGEVDEQIPQIQGG